MAFTYDPNLLTDRDWIRLQIGDTIENKGPRLDGKNYSDEEIAALLLKAKDDTNVVVAQIFGVLATEWSSMAVSYTIGPRKEDLYRIAEMYTKKALEWAKIAGLLSSTFSSGFYRAGSRENSELN